MYFFRPLNKDPENPWSLSTTGYRHFSARWTGLALLVFGVLMAAYSVYQDYSFLPGAAYTNGTFVKITGSRISLTGTPKVYTEYFGQYRYAIGGSTYLITQNDDETQGEPTFKPTIRIAYKEANPAHAIIVYGNTLQIDARGNVADGLGAGVAGYTLIYLLCAPITAVRNRKRRNAGGQTFTSTQVDAAAQTALKELQAREAAKASVTGDSPQAQSDKPPA